MALNTSKCHRCSNLYLSLSIPSLNSCIWNSHFTNGHLKPNMFETNSWSSSHRPAPLTPSSDFQLFRPQILASSLIFSLSHTPHSKHWQILLSSKHIQAQLIFYDLDECFIYYPSQKTLGIKRDIIYLFTLDNVYDLELSYAILIHDYCTYR